MSTTNIVQILDNQRKTFFSGKTLPLEYRLEQLRALRRFLLDQEQPLLAAARKDLGKPETETFLTEHAMIMKEIALFESSLSQWVKSRRVSTEIQNKLDTCEIQFDPYGLCLIIGAWNYPIQLTLLPVIGAIGAGNCVVLKPSELSPTVASIFDEHLKNYMDPATFSVICGAAKETTELLEQKWDHIFYTGGGVVGRIVMTAAAKHLTPVVLELGGKSPCIVDNVSAGRLENACQRIAWGKFLNCGQSCIAPDYVLITPDVYDAFLEQMKKTIRTFYGDNIQQNPDLGRIVNQRHFQRITKMLPTTSSPSSMGKIYFGGHTDEKELFIEPTIVTDMSPDSPLMQEELFAPILPVLKVSSVDEAIQFVQRRDKPLALYVFTDSSSVSEKVLRHTTSGSACVNETMMQAGVHTLPFGGVGPSGLGAYHGHYSFESFSHKKAVLQKSLGFEFLNKARYPPYSEKKLAFLRKALGYPFIKSGKTGKFLFLAIAFLIGGLAVSYYYKNRTL